VVLWDISSLLYLTLDIPRCGLFIVSSRLMTSSKSATTCSCSSVIRKSDNNITCSLLIVRSRGGLWHTTILHQNSKNFFTNVTNIYFPISIKIYAIKSSNSAMPCSVSSASIFFICSATLALGVFYMTALYSTSIRSQETYRILGTECCFHALLFPTDLQPLVASLRPSLCYNHHISSTR